jgi:hypothetical protein
MKKVTKFREHPQNFKELYDTEFGGILANYARNTEKTEVKKTDGIPFRRNSVDTLNTGH